MRLFLYFLMLMFASGCKSIKPTSIKFDGSILAGETFEHYFCQKYRFILMPREFGWQVAVKEDGRDEFLQRLTAPYHFVPNDTEIEGWHFRNEDNTKPNDGTVNAPQFKREFIFSPEVGRSIQGPTAGTAPTAEEVEKVKSFGSGILQITELELSPPRRGEKARILKMSFQCAITTNDRE